MNKKKQTILVAALILSMILIISGVTYAFFNYARQGTTDNTIETGSITFLYTENSGTGRGVSIVDAYPISDEVGKTQTGSDKMFDFKITSNTMNKTAIEYEITARKSKDSTLAEDVVKVYLTKVDGTTEEEIVLSKYSDLTQTTKVNVADYTEKTLYTKKIPSNTANFEESYRLRMWIDEETDFSGVEQEDGTIVYPYNDKTFKLTVNVYANGEVLTQEEIDFESNVNISTLSVDGTELTQVTDQDYDYSAVLPEGTTQTTINVETENENAKVTVERVDSLAYSNNIKRLSTQKTLDLVDGYNYFKITVTSENNKSKNEYKLKFFVGDLTLSTAINFKYSVIDAEPNLKTSSNNTSDASGLYKSTDTNSGNPTYYFRGNVDNTVEFAEKKWKVIRINEDGTVRLIMVDGINDNTPYVFNSTNHDYTHMYYSNSEAKTTLETWYQTNVVEAGYSANIVTGDYFCEEARVKNSSSYTSGNATMELFSEYTPTFKCSNDENTKGIVNSSIGLITYDESVYAGAYRYQENNDYYLYDGDYFWTMSPAGVTSRNTAYIWNFSNVGHLYDDFIGYTLRLRPVINLKADTPVIFSDTSDTVWKIVE